MASNKNGGLVPDNVGSYRKVWWLGTCGHEWEAAIVAVVNGSGCNICAGKQILVGFNDLATTHPGLAKEWHPTRNEGT